MVESGAMEASEREILALSSNVALVSTYWMSFQRVRSRHGSEDAGGDAAGGGLDRAAYQVLALIAPYLVGDGRALVERLGQEYL
jgi:hypothetical protein